MVSLSHYWTNTNINVKLVLIFTFMWMFARGLWESRQLPLFIYSLDGSSSTTVGYATSLVGIVQLITAVPAGMIADRSRRDILLRSAAVFASMAISAMIFAVLYNCMISLYVAMVLWGLVYSLNDSPMEALFADSTATGKRATIFAVKHTLVQFGSSAAAIAAAILFGFVGNQWTLHILRIVIIVGLLIMVVPVLVMCFCSDDNSLDPTISESAQHLLSERRNEELAEQRAMTVVMRHRSSIPANPDRLHSRLMSLPITRLPTFRTIKGPDHSVLHWTPYVVATTDLLTALGSGALVNFFPIFFTEEFSLEPVSLSLLFAFTPLMTGAASLVVQDIALKFGRAHVILVLHLFGALLLYIFAITRALTASILLFIVMTAVMNSIKPLKRSILMDVVPSSRRGLWNAFESFAKFSWSGSAALGGLLIDLYGYRITFMIVSCLYTLSSIPVFVLLRMDIDSLVAEACVDVEEAAAAAVAAGNDVEALMFASSN